MSKSAETTLRHGMEFPYDADWSEEDVIPEGDWATRAARGVLADLTDRRGIKQELRGVDLDIRREIVESLADIIRTAWEQEQGQ